MNGNPMLKKLFKEFLLIFQCFESCRHTLAVVAWVDGYCIIGFERKMGWNHNETKRRKGFLEFFIGAEESYFLVIDKKNIIDKFLKNISLVLGKDNCLVQLLIDFLYLPD